MQAGKQAGRQAVSERIIEKSSRPELSEQVRGRRAVGRANEAAAAAATRCNGTRESRLSCCFGSHIKNNSCETSEQGHSSNNSIRNVTLVIITHDHKRSL